LVKDGIRCGGSWVFEDGDGVSGFVEGVWMGGVLLLDVCEYFLLVHVGSLLFLIMNKSLLSSIIYYNFSTITIAFLTSFLVLEFKRKLPVFFL